MTSREPDLRAIMAAHILNFGVRRDRAGRLCAAGDGTVPGLPRAAGAKVGVLLAEARFGEAEAAAVRIVARYTDKVAGLARDPGVELVLRDCCWEGGPGHANAVLRGGIGLPAGLGLGADVRAAIAAAERSPHGLIRALQGARRDCAGLISARDEKRWAAVTRLALTLSPRAFRGDGLKVA